MLRKSLLLFAGLLFSITLPASPDGAQLFERHCSACHGLHGHGGVGVPLALPSFQAAVSDQFLFTTIRQGRPGRVMPSFSNLSDDQIKAIIHHIRQWAPKQANKTFTKFKPGRGNEARGKKLFARYCAHCHGSKGEGGHGTGVTFSRPRNLPIMPPALNNVGFLKAADDAMIKRTLMEGRQGTPMSSFLRLGLQEQDIDDIVSYVRSFERNPLRWKHNKDKEAAIRMESEYDLETTVENIQRAAIGRNFRIIRVQYLEDGLFDEKQVNKKQVIVYFCNFNLINGALQLDPRVGLFMPCRITALEHDDGTVEVVAINPLYISRLYNNTELDESCKQMHDTYLAIMDEATL